MGKLYIIQFFILYCKKVIYYLFIKIWKESIYFYNFFFRITCYPEDFKEHEKTSDWEMMTRYKTEFCDKELSTLHKKVYLFLFLGSMF